MLIVPQIPARVKEWAYAGSGITFISAAIAHYKMADKPDTLAPQIFFVIPAVSNIYLDQIKKAWPSQKIILLKGQDGLSSCLCL